MGHFRRGHLGGPTFVCLQGQPLGTSLPSWDQAVSVAPGKKSWGKEGRAWGPGALIQDGDSAKSAPSTSPLIRLVEETLGL